MKVSLEAIPVPFHVADDGFASLLLGSQQLSAKGQFALTSGEWSIGDESPLGITISDDTHGTFECAIVLRGERTDDDRIALWPAIESFVVQLDKPIGYTEQGPTFALQAIDLGSKDTGDVAKAVEVQIADTLAFAVSSLTSNATAQRITPNSPLELVSSLSLEYLDVRFVEPTDVVMPGLRLVVQSGAIRLRDVAASFADEALSSEVEVTFRLGEGTEFSSDDARLTMKDAQLDVLLQVEHREGAWTVAPSMASDRGTLTVREGVLEIRDASIELNETALSLERLAIDETGLTLAFDGDLRLSKGSARVGPTQVMFDAGIVEACSINLDGNGASEPKVDFRDLRFENVRVQVALGDSDALQVEAKTLSVSSRMSVDTPLAIDLSAASLLYKTDADQQEVTAEAELVVLSVAAPGAVGIGALAPVDGARLSAKWDSIRVGGDGEAIDLGPTGLEIQINQAEPLNADITLHTSSSELVDRSGSIGALTVRAGVSAEGTMSLQLDLPFATMNDLLRLAIPAALDFDLSPSMLDQSALNTLGLEGNRTFTKLRDHTRIGIALEGQNDLVLASRGGGINVSGILQATITVEVELGRYAKILEHVRGRSDGADDQTGSVELIRRRRPIDVDWTLDLRANAPVAPPDFAILARPVFPVADNENWLATTIREFLEKKSSESPLKLPLGERFAHQLAPADGLFIDKADLTFDDTAVTVAIQARTER